MAVPKNTDTATGSITTAASLTTLVEHVASTLKPHDWSRRSCGIGTKGFRVYDWALVDAGDGHQYVFRRNIADGELAYFHCYNPRREPMTELVRVIGTRWPIEECFEAAKGEAGLDNYQARLYHAWYRHITLAMLAMAFLAVMRHTSKKGPFACGQTTRPDRANPPQQPDRQPDRPRRTRRLIALSLAEVQRLFNLTGQGDHTIGRAVSRGTRLSSTDRELHDVLAGPCLLAIGGTLIGALAPLIFHLRRRNPRSAHPARPSSREIHA